MTWYAEGLHRTEEGYIVTPKSVVPALHSQRNCMLHIGTGAIVQGSISHEGSLILAPRSQVWGEIRGGHEVILANGAKSEAIHAFGRVVVQEGATCGDIDAGSDVWLLGTCDVGTVRAGGDIVIVGAPKTKGLQPGGRIQTRPF